MTRTFLLIVLCLHSLSLFCQYTDDFSDTDLYNNPQWLGDVSSFIVNDQEELQLNDAEAGSAYIYLNAISADELEWICAISLHFSPSANNFMRFYLCAYGSDNDGCPYGYYLQFGESGAADRPELCYASEEACIVLGRLEDIDISHSFELKLRIRHHTEGSWEIAAFDEEQLLWGQPTLISSPFPLIGEQSGYYCQYTISNATRFYMDDFYCGPFQIDDIPPEVKEWSMESPTCFKLAFTEVMEETSVQASNIRLNPGAYVPQLIEWQDDSFRSALIHFQENELTEDYQLCLNGLQDLALNTMRDTCLLGSYHQVESMDIAFSEIMADPSPVVGLPDVEYVELYNRSGDGLELKGCTYTWKNHSYSLPPYYLAPEECVILCRRGNDSTALSPLTPYIIGVPSFSLLNDGDKLCLYNAAGDEITAITYSPDMHTDRKKVSGGYSLELQYTDQACVYRGNWMTSANEMGGSPGIYLPSSVNFQPIFSEWSIQDSLHLKFHLNYGLENWAGWSKDGFSIEGIANQIAELTYDKEGFYLLKLKERLEKGQQFSLKVDLSLLDCLQEEWEITEEYNWQIPFPIYKGDIVFSEVLFEGSKSIGEYIELQVLGNKCYDASDIQLSVSKTPDEEGKKYRISNERVLLAEDQFVCMAADTLAIQNHFLCPSEELTLLKLPMHLNNEEGHLLLSTLQGDTIDHMAYSRDMHHPILESTAGVSLEKVNLYAPSSDAKQWCSAASTVNHHSPGCPNSQQSWNAGNAGQTCTLVSEFFSPNNDGFQDYAEICWDTDSPANQLEVHIFSRNGVLLKRLMEREYIGNSGSVLWNGSNDNNELLPPAVYIIIADFTDERGKRRREKLPVVLVRE